MNFDDMDAILIIRFYNVPELVGYTRNKPFHKIFRLHKFKIVYLRISLEDICQILDHQFVTCNYKDFFVLESSVYYKQKFQTKINLVSILYV